MLADKDIILLRWFFNRLIYKHRLDPNDTIYKQVYEIIPKLEAPLQISIDQANLDRIICKYYVDFELAKCEHLGYTDTERDRLRQTVLDLTRDIYNFSRIGLNNVTTS